METSSLAGVWFFIIITMLLLYVLLDGFDLGAGILTLFVKDKDFIGASIGSIHGIWHANQTWLVVVGASLFGAFPLAYSVILSALYIPVALMLLGLIIRGLAVEFYYSTDNRNLLDRAYGVGSLIMAMAQGAGVGAIMAGLPSVDGKFAGSVWGWISPFSILVALGLPILYCLLGSTWLIMKTNGKVQESSRKAARMSLILTIAGAAAVAVYGLAFKAFWAQGWFTGSHFATTLLPVLLGLAALAAVFASLGKGGDKGPFVLSLAGGALLFLGVATGVYPYITPPSITAAQAAADPITLKFMITGIAIVLPLIIIYTFYMYRIFGGKVGELGHEA